MARASARKKLLSVGWMVSSAMHTLGGWLHAYTTAAATSSGCTMISRSSGGIATGRLSRIGVATSPGLMQMLRMPLMPSSAFSVWLMARAPNFAAV